MHHRPFLVVRERPANGRPHAYDVVLDWIRENFPDYLPLFRLASLPLELGEADFSLHVAWLNDPVQAYSMERYEQATALAAACDARGIPVINRVDRLFNATKLLGASLIARAGVRVPKMARITDREAFLDTLCGIPLPLIIRDDWGHQGELLRADTLDEARALPLDRFARPIAVELIDVRDRRDGYCRKYRYFGIGDIGVSSHLQISSDWITRGEARIPGENSRLEELDYIGRPDPNHLALQEARRALELDFVAFDYGYDEDGRVVVWEANPYPYLHFSTKTLVYRNASMHRTIAGMLKLYLDRAGIATPERLEALLDYSQAPSSTKAGIAPMAVTLTEPVPSRTMRCIGEFPVKVGAGDVIQLKVAPALAASVLVLSRSDDGRATPVPLQWGTNADPHLATLGIDAVGPLLLTILADEPVAATTVEVIRQPAQGAATHLHGSGVPASRFHLARAILPAKGERVDFFRIRSTLDGVTRYCLVALTLDAQQIEGGSFSTLLKAAYRYVDVPAGATQIPNSFGGAGEVAFFLLPWSQGDRRQQLEGTTGFEALAISRIVGAASAADAPAPATGSPQTAREEEQTLWALDRAYEAHVAQLIEMARRTTSETLRQDIVDRLIAMNRCPDALISRPGINARAGSSFRRSLLTWSRRAELQRGSLHFAKALEWRVKDKDEGYRLAGLLGATLLSRHGPFSAEEAISNALAAAGPVVIKPLGGSGSRGVFVVQGPLAILDLQRQQWMANVDVLRSILNDLKWDRWLVEDFAADPDNPLCPAPDLKFYSFYGRVGLVLEVERYPMTRYAWWLRDGEPTFTGHYQDHLFEGRGFAPEHLAAAERISAQLPFPFMRIDLLRGQDLFFGEFTPRPGDFERFIPSMDAFLGDQFLDADLRLWRDLLNGRRFTDFMEWAAPFIHADPTAADPPGHPSSSLEAK